MNNEELHFSKAILSWRSFNIAGDHLMSPFLEYIWEPNQKGIFTAECRKDLHPCDKSIYGEQLCKISPGNDCSCGLYSYHSLDNNSLYMCFGNAIVAIVANWGQVEVHRRGMRSQYMKILGYLSTEERSHVQGLEQADFIHIEHSIFEKHLEKGIDKAIEKYKNIAEPLEVSSIMVSSFEDFAEEVKLRYYLKFPFQTYSLDYFIEFINKYSKEVYKLEFLHQLGLAPRSFQNLYDVSKEILFLDDMLHMAIEEHGLYGDFPNYYNSVLIKREAIANMLKDLKDHFEGRG